MRAGPLRGTEARDRLRPAAGHPARPATSDQSRSAAREWAGIGALAAVGPVLAWLGAAATGVPAFNDFNVYWLAGQLVDRGLSPHDGAALADLARQQGRDFVLGGGYSYPLPFAVAMVPLSRLPFEAALGVFLAGSIAAFALAVAGWLRWLGTWTPGHGAPLRRIRAAALLAGFFPPVLGTVATGQANLLVLGVLAPGVACLLSPGGRVRVAGGVLAGLASVVKLVPLVVAAPLVLARRSASAAALLAGVAGALAGAALLAPGSTQGSESLVSLLAADPYFTNISINGFVSRLLITTDQTLALVPGLVPAVPAMTVATGLFALATMRVLWRARTRLADRGGLALALAFALLAGVAGGPKNSFWNAALALVPVGLLLAVLAPDLDLRRLARLPAADRRLLLVFLGAIVVQPVAWLAPGRAGGAPIAWLQTLAGSIALAGLLALWWVAGRALRHGLGDVRAAHPALS